MCQNIRNRMEYGISMLVFSVFECEFCHYQILICHTYWVYMNVGFTKPNANSVNIFKVLDAFHIARTEPFEYFNS